MTSFRDFRGKYEKETGEFFCGEDKEGYYKYIVWLENRLSIVNLTDMLYDSSVTKMLPYITVLNNEYIGIDMDIKKPIQIDIEGELVYLAKTSELHERK